MSIAPKIKVIILREGAIPPQFMSADAAGADLAAFPDEALVLPPGGRALVPTGIALEIPPGFEGEVRPRSGLAVKFGVSILNSPGTIDADYRGEVNVILINHGDRPFKIGKGDRIAQLLIKRVESAEFVVADELTETDRGGGGFGSSGI